MGTEAVSRMLSTHLYYRRSFPFYTFNIVGGLDEEGKITRLPSPRDVLAVRGHTYPPKAPHSTIAFIIRSVYSVNISIYIYTCIYVST